MYEEKTTLKKIVILLDSIGYEPDLNLAEKEVEKSAIINKKLWYKIGIAGFAAGNIMLFSFPEYLGINEIGNDEIKPVFSYLNIIFSLSTQALRESKPAKKASLGLISLDEVEIFCILLKKYC